MSPPPDPAPAPAPEMQIRLLNLGDHQKINQFTNTLLRVQTTKPAETLQVFANGASLGFAVYRPAEKEFRLNYKFQTPGDFDLKFVALSAAPRSSASKTVRVSVVKGADPIPSGPTSASFNDYILKAIAFEEKTYGLLGYNIHGQLTHDLAFGPAGTLKATQNGQTMCVAAQYELIVVALQIYAQETGDSSVFSYLPFQSWNTLASDALKAQIWVDPKLDSFGTADALTHFGMGELVPFEQLKPGDFININRVNGSGHAVNFISYIDNKGTELPKYDSTVVGFKYFSSQGHATKGEGGYDYRYAFFDKFGCPNLPLKRDCGLIFKADDRKYLNMGQMLHPKFWKHPGSRLLQRPLAQPAAEDMKFYHRPALFNGLTTDD